MSYLIKVINTTASDSFSYYADTHPTKGEHLYLRSTRFKVKSVEHILTTKDVGSKHEYHELAYVAITVVEA